MKLDESKKEAINKMTSLNPSHNQSIEYYEDFEEFISYEPKK